MTGTKASAKNQPAHQRQFWKLSGVSVICANAPASSP
jgi:hypothetical protein